MYLHLHYLLQRGHSSSSLTLTVLVLIEEQPKDVVSDSKWWSPTPNASMHSNIQHFYYDQTTDIVMSWQHHVLTLHHHSTSTKNMTINTIYHSNIVSWPPLMQPPLLQHCLPPPTTPTPARKPSLCHESSYSFSPIPIVLLSSVVIQFSSVTYEPAYELLLPYVRSCQQHTNNHSKFKHNNQHDHDLSQHDHATNIASRSI